MQRETIDCRDIRDNTSQKKVKFMSLRAEHCKGNNKWRIKGRGR